MIANPDSIHPKVIAGTSGSLIGSAATVLVVWILSLYNVTVPVLPAQAMTLVFGSLFGFIAAYQTSSPTKEGIQ